MLVKFSFGNFIVTNFLPYTIENFIFNYDNSLATVSIIWFESDLYIIPDKYVTELLAHYFNKADEHGKEVVVTYKETGLPPEIGVEDFEMGRENHITKYAWLTDDMIGTRDSKTWGYASHMKIKSTPYLIHVLIDIVSKNGVLLLNISPKADGTIPEDQKQVLLDMGEWLGKYGEAIYETRPWYTFGEGPTKEPEGHFSNRKEFMKLKYSAKDIRYTTKGNTVYAVLLGKPISAEDIVLESFSVVNAGRSISVKEITVLGSGVALEWEMSDKGLNVHIPDTGLDEKAVVLKIETPA